MGVVLVTVVYGTRRRDLAVRSDVPVAALLRPLLDALIADPHGDTSPAREVSDPALDPNRRHGGGDTGSELRDLRHSRGATGPGSEPGNLRQGRQSGDASSEPPGPGRDLDPLDSDLGRGLGPGLEIGPGRGLDLGRVCGPALPRDGALAACGVWHGDVLVLLDR
jgi:hypothetical protein